MAQDFKRTDRIAEQMQRDLAELIRTSLKDPRIGMITVNSVDVARDLGYAEVYVTLLTVDDLDADGDGILDSTTNVAAGFLRTELGRMIKLRKIPQLRFHFDASVKRGRQLDQLISKARKSDVELGLDDTDSDSSNDSE